MSVLAPAVLVFETRSRWEAELKRELPAEGVLVRPCRSGADLLELCRLMPGSVAVIDLDAGGESVLHALALANAGRLAVSPVVISSTGSEDCEWPLRELGAVAVVPETIRGGDLADLCHRLLKSALCVESAVAT